MELARLIADIEPRKRDDVRFRFFARWDCEQADRDTIAHVANKFDVSWAKTCSYKWDGWPAGPNGIALEVLDTAWNWLKKIGWSDTTALLMLEPDAVPLSSSWLDQLKAEWHEHGFSQANAGGAWQIGAWRNSGGEHGHINGNCLIRPNIRAVLNGMPINPYVGWDCGIAPYMREHWHHSGLFLNHFQSTGAKLEDLLRPETGARSPVLVHGYKDNSAMKIARQLAL